MDRTVQGSDRFHQALQAARAGAWEWDIETDDVFWSDENYLVMGLKPGEIEPNFEGWCRLVHPEDLPGILQAVELAIQEKRDIDLEYRVIWPSGEERWIKDVGRTVLGPTGEPAKMYGIQIDITEQKLAERAVRESELMYRRIVETANEGIWIVGPDHQTVFVNWRLARLLGYTVDEMMQREVYEFLDARSIEQIRLLLDPAEDRPRERELLLNRRDGSNLWALVKGNSIPGPQERQAETLLMVTDISQRKKARDELRRSREELRRLSTALARAREAERTRVARELHDELGQSLTALKIDLQMIEARVPLDDLTGRERAAAAMGLVNGTIERVRRLAADLRPGILDDLGLSAAVEWELQEFSRRTGTVTRLDRGSVLDQLSGESVIVAFRVLQEALTNVMRHAGAEAVTVLASRRGGSVVLSITDNGRGFTPRNGYAPGALGLLGMRERAISVRGSLEVAAKIGEGTTITLMLPCRKVADPVQNLPAGRSA